jgi:hypothetical protein
MCDRVEMYGKTFELKKVDKKRWGVFVDGERSRFTIKPHRQHKQLFWAVVDGETGLMTASVYSSRGYALVMVGHAFGRNGGRWV